jgi:hypothetical protein
MKASIYRLLSPGDLRVVEEEVRPCDRGMVLGQTVYSLVSPGTEIGAWKGLSALRAGTGYPRVVGYCNLARVLESGDESVAQGDYILTHQSHRSHFCIPAAEVLVKASADPAAAATYLYYLSSRALEGADVDEVAIVGLGALGYAAADLAVSRAIKTTVFTNQNTSIADVEMRPKSATGEFRHVVLTSNRWDDYKLALRLATQTVTLLGFPGRGEATMDFNPLSALYPRGLTLRQIGEVPQPQVESGMQRVLQLLPHLRTEPLVGHRIPWTQLGQFYSARSSYSALLEW